MLILVQKIARLKSYVLEKLNYNSHEAQCCLKFCKILAIFANIIDRLDFDRKERKITYK